MAVLNQIAFFQNRRDEVPNQILAQALAAKQDMAGIREIAANLWHENPNVRGEWNVRAVGHVWGRGSLQTRRRRHSGIPCMRGSVRDSQSHVRAELWMECWPENGTLDLSHWDFTLPLDAEWAARCRCCFSFFPMNDQISSA